MRQLGAECSVDPDPIDVTSDGLAPPARFHVRTDAELKSWLIRILNPEGTVLRDLSGDGQPPETVEWNGKNPSGTVVVRPNNYVFRCLLTDADGNRAVSARHVLPLGTQSGGASYSKAFVRADYPNVDALQKTVLAELDEVVAAIEAGPGSSVHIT